MHARDLPYRPCVGLMLVNPDGRIWVGRRIDTVNGWQMPQGGIDQGESARAAALRELHEEIGTDKAEIVAESQTWHCYDLRTTWSARPGVGATGARSSGGFCCGLPAVTVISISTPSTRNSMPGNGCPLTNFAT